VHLSLHTLHAVLQKDGQESPTDTLSVLVPSIKTFLVHFLPLFFFRNFLQFLPLTLNLGSSLHVLPFVTIGVAKGVGLAVGSLPPLIKRGSVSQCLLEEWRVRESE
jgi:hypothetical protein